MHIKINNIMMYHSAFEYLDPLALVSETFLFLGWADCGRGLSSPAVNVLGLNTLVSMVWLEW